MKIKNFKQNYIKARKNNTKERIKKLYKELNVASKSGYIGIQFFLTSADTFLPIIIRFFQYKGINVIKENNMYIFTWLTKRDRKIYLEDRIKNII